jgi:4'-phosphopantetheinyl transferase
MLPTLHIPDDVHLRSVPVAEAIRADWESILSHEERRRRAEMKNEARRNSFTAGRVVLRKLLSEELGVSPVDVPLTVLDSGRLGCEDSDLHLSLAHSGQLAVAAASERNIGFDLEAIRPKPSSLLNYILADEEREHIKALDLDGDLSLFLCWTVKEAVLKANGTGLRRSPRLVRVDIDLETSIAHVSDPADHAWEVYFGLSDDYAAALAVQPM